MTEPEYKNWRRFQPSRAAKPKDLREPDDPEEEGGNCEVVEDVRPFGKKNQRKRRAKQTRAKPTAVVDSPEEKLLDQACFRSRENAAFSASDAADARVLSGASYRDLLYGCSVSPEGMDKLCRAIEERIVYIQKMHNLEPSADTLNLSITEMMHIANTSIKPGFGKEVGMALNSDTTDLLDISLLPDDSKYKYQTIKLEEREDLEKLGFGFLGVLATYNSESTIDLVDLYRKVRCVNYDPTYINCAVISFPLSDARALVFANGKLVFPGATNTKEVWIAARNTLELLKMCGYSPVIKKEKLQIHNVTGMLDLDSHVDIIGFHQAYDRFTHYNSDVFCAVSYFPERERQRTGPPAKSVGICYQIFSTGKILIVGARNERNIPGQLVQLIHMLSPFVSDRNTGLRISKPDVAPKDNKPDAELKDKLDIIRKALASKGC